MGTTALSDPAPDAVARLVPSDAEGRRSRAVASLGLNEPHHRPRLDRVTRLARMMFRVPISTVTVLDGDRAYFPSVQGMDLQHLPRKQTLCETVVAVEDLLLVEGAQDDRRFDDIESVRAGAVRFYAGRPLRDRDGTVIGSFCIIDERPRSLDADELRAFEELAQLAEREVQAAHEDALISATHAVLQPRSSLRRGPWRIETACVPAQSVGGDFCDVHAGPRGLMVGLGDVMGKGTSAALIGASVRGTLRGSLTSFMQGGGDLGHSFGMAARALWSDLERAGSFVTIFGALIDPDSGQVRYLDAGSGLCLVRRSDGTVDRLAGPGRPIGVLPDDEWAEETDTLMPGDRMLLFSDGLLDLIEDQTRWQDPVRELLAAHTDPASLVDHIRRLTRERTGIDDVTVVAVYRDPA
ncbi:MAG: PP2C family protein-serine/threonine phosphatase [Nocardioides sp.]